MTEHNHRRGTKRKSYDGVKPVITVTHKVPGTHHIYGKNYHTEIMGDTIVATRFDSNPLKNGNPHKREWGYLDKAGHGAGLVILDLSDRIVSGKGVGDAFCNGHRGMAKAVRGSKKFVRSRTRFHENAATRKLGMDNYEE